MAYKSSEDQRRWFALRNERLGAISKKESRRRHIEQLRADYVGKVFGYLTVTDVSTEADKILFVCSCLCGTESTRKKKGDVLSGNTSLCSRKCPFFLGHGGPENWSEERTQWEKNAKDLGYASLHAACANKNIEYRSVLARLRKGESVEEALSYDLLHSPQVRIRKKSREASKDGFKICCDCGTEKPSDETHFKKSPPNIGGYFPRCIPCHRRKCRKNKLEERYALTETDISEMLSRQNFQCAACAVSIGASAPVDYHVDHAPTDVEDVLPVVRGLLCASCNGTLACFERGDVLAVRHIAERAVAYVKHPPGAPPLEHSAPERRSTRDGKLWTRFALIEADVTSMSVRGCNICEAPAATTLMCVDHDHSKYPESRGPSGKSVKAFSEDYRKALRSSVRGVLCSACNTGIGRVEALFWLDAATFETKMFSIVTYIENFVPYVTPERQALFDKNLALRARRSKKKKKKLLTESALPSSSVSSA